jgi:hypothetical protein
MARARRLEVEIVGDARSYERTLNRAGGATSGFGRTVKKAAAIAVTAGLTMGVGVAAGAVKAIKASSNLGEQISKTGVVFGKSGKDVQRWSEDLASSFGLSQREALEAAGTYGNMLVPMGLARNEAAGMSQRMVELAADMASFNNASPVETLDALRAGLAGETEPLRRFGVFLNAARVEEEAMRLGLAKSKKDMTAAAKAQATYSLILKDSSDTQGDFSRTSNSLANRQRILRAAFENTAAKLGTAFLPAATAVLGFVSDELLPGFDKAADVIGGFWTRVSKDFTEAKGVRAKIEVVWEGVRNLAQSIADEVSDAMPDVDWNATGEAILDGIVPAMKQGGRLARAVADLFDETLDKVNWEEVGRKAGPFLAAMVASAFATLSDPSFWARNWDLALAVGLTAFGGAIGRFAGAALARVGGRLVRLGEDMLLSIAGGVEKLSPRLGTAFVTAAMFGARTLAGAIGRLWRVVENAASGVWARMGPLLRTALRVGWIAAIASAISSAGEFVTGKATQFYNWGKGVATSLVDGFADGIRAGVDKVKAAIDWVTDKIPGFIKGPLGVSSPSKVTMDIGRELAEGLGVGFGLGSVTVSNSMADRLNSMVDRMISAVQARRGDLSAAFSDLASSALAGFDQLTAAHETPTEKKMRAEDEARAARDRQERLKDARKAWQQAVAEQDPEAIAAAQREINEAEFAIQRAADEKQATQERKAYDDSRALRRRHFEEELADLAALAERKALSAEQVNKKMLGIFKRYGVPFRGAGKTLGLAIAEGISDAADAVARASAKLRRTIATHLGVIDITIRMGPGGGAPGRAGGGRVMPGSPYITGERGRELFVPDEPGRIIPHGQTEALLAGAGRGAGPTVYIETYNAQSDRDAELIASAAWRRLAFRR